MEHIWVYNVEEFIMWQEKDLKQYMWWLAFGGKIRNRKEIKIEGHVAMNSDSFFFFFSLIFIVVLQCCVSMYCAAK